MKLCLALNYGSREEITDAVRKIARRAAAGELTPDDIDTGAVILTGEALKRDNARAIADLFAEESGKFVCASAGHNMEALMAANGSGAVALSRQDHQTILNIDTGGGTIKLGLCHGEVIACPRQSMRRRDG